MGLDMYLEARKYVSKVDWKASKEAGYPEQNILNAEYESLIKFLPKEVDEFGETSGIKISATIGYWRKANSIHQWFIDNCAGGEDDCSPIHVYWGKLVELRAVVEEVLENPETASKHLPTASGFFFGSTEYDEYYISDLKRTILIIDKALSLPEDEYDIIYQASW